MASGFPSGGGGGGGGGGDFYNATAFGGGIGGTSGMIGGNNVQLQYRQQQLQQLQQLQHLQQQQDQFSSISSAPFARRNMANFGVKRPISDLHQQQQQQQQGFFMRSVKQRNQYNHTSPISPLTPFDFSSSSSLNYSSHPHMNLQQQLRSLPITNSNTTNLYSPSLFLPNRVQQPPVEKECESVKNRLQELEKQLLDDDDDDNNDEGDVVSGVTSNEWSETMQNLISPSTSTNMNPNPNPNQTQIQNPFSPSPSSSSTSSSASSSSPSNATSSKQSFLDIATAISEGNIEVATVKLDHLHQISNPRGDCEQRLISYMVSALRSRVNPADNPPPVADLFSQEQNLATQLLFGASPCFNFGFMASNLAIMEATRDQPSDIHVIDFDIGQGIQYLNLIHAVAEREKQSKVTSVTPIVIRVTSVVLDSVSEADCRMVGDRLRKLADRVGVGLKFNMVCKRITEVSRESLCCEVNEALVVNFAFKLQKLSDESVSTENPRDELLRRVKSLNPRVVTVVEQEMNCNTAPFVARVGEVSSYYLALFNSLDSTMPRDKLERVKIEEGLGRKAANSVACEGRERVERCEVFGKWRARMRMAGFASRPLGGHVAESIKAKLASVYKSNPGFTVREEADGIFFGWNDRMLTVASSWC